MVSFYRPSLYQPAKMIIERRIGFKANIRYYSDKHGKHAGSKMSEMYVDGMMQGPAGRLSMAEMSRQIKVVATQWGAVDVGISTLASLAGGPPSTDLSYVMDDARAAITFVIPLDDEAIRKYLAKEDRVAHQKDQNVTNTLASGIAAQAASYLEQFGARAKAVMANNVYREGEGVRYVNQFPDISHRYLAVASGLGWFGFSGNVLTPEYGPNVIFATTVTDAPLLADEPLRDEDNYCDDCQACNASCPSGFFRYGTKEKENLTMNGRDFNYAKRRAYARCSYVCAGYNGVHPNGRWSTWSPARFPIPKNDKELKTAYKRAIPAMQERSMPGGGHSTSAMAFGFNGDDLWTSCGNCSLVCHPEREERDRRIKTLHTSGAVVQHEDGRLEAMPGDEAKAFVAAMPPERRRAYEFVEEEELAE